MTVKLHPPLNAADKFHAKHLLFEASRGNLIDAKQYVLGIRTIESGTLPILELTSGPAGKKNLIIMTLEGIRCDCGKGLLCPLNSQIQMKQSTTSV